MPWLDECRILQRAEQSISRELRYGELVVRDEVRTVPQLQLWVHVPAQGDIADSTLAMTIEEPQQGHLFVRFDYDIGEAEPATGDAAFYEEYRRSAYVDADIETVRVIRQLAAEGRLGSA